MKISKRSKIWIHSISIGVLVAGGIVGATLGGIFINDAKNNAARQRKENHNVQLDIPNESTSTLLGYNKNKKLLKKDINVVSLGDSIGAGFTLYDFNDHRGDKEGKKITGMSYGSYIAKSLQKAHMLGSYKNYSIGGFTSRNLLELIDPNIKLEQVDKKKKNIAIGHVIKKDKLETWTKKNKALKVSEIQNSIKDANVITITIGANDLLDIIKLLGISVTEFMDVINGNSENLKKLDFSSIASADPKKIEKIIANIEINLMQLCNIIEILNPNAEIIIVGYPMPLMQERQLLKELIIDKETGLSKLEVVLKLLSSTGKHISENKPNVNFIDIDYEKIWSKYSRKLANVFHDIHPTSLGYRFMAGIILDKISHPIKEVVIEHPNNNKNLDIFDIYKNKKGEYDDPQMHFHSKLDRSSISKDPNIEVYDDKTPRTFKQIIKSSPKLEKAINDLYDFSYIDSSSSKIKMTLSKKPFIDFGEAALDHLNGKHHELVKQIAQKETSNQKDEPSPSFISMIGKLFSGGSSKSKKINLVPILHMVLKLAETLERTEIKWNTLTNLKMLIEEKLVPAKKDNTTTSKSQDEGTGSSSANNVFKIFIVESSKTEPKILNELLKDSNFKNIIVSLLDVIEKELKSDNKENIKLGLNYFMKLFIDFLPFILKIDSFKNLLEGNEGNLSKIKTIISKDGMINQELKRNDKSNAFSNHPLIAKFLADPKNVLFKFLDKQTLTTDKIKKFAKDKSNFLSILKSDKDSTKTWNENDFKKLGDFK